MSNSQKCNAAIFDLDGTLLDSMGVWDKIDVDFLAKRNIIPPKNYNITICAMSFKEAAAYTINLFDFHETVDEIIAEWNEMAIDEYSHNIALKPHAKEFILALKSVGIKIALATGSPKSLFEPALKHNGIYDLFDVFCSADEVRRGKEFPDIFLLTAKRLGIPPENCIVFDDIFQAICSAKQAGMRTCGVFDETSISLAEKIKDTADFYLLDWKDKSLLDEVF